MALSARQRFRRLFGLLVGIAVIGAVVVGVRRFSMYGTESSHGVTTAVPVTASIATRQDVPATISALGTVQAIDTVAIQARVSGTILSIGFTPGQNVTQGQQLFLIDPRPFEQALRVQQSQLAHDQGLLAEAEVDLKRYQTLQKENSIARQQAEDQFYVVQQYKGTVALDEANVAIAQLNVKYTRITSPISGRAGALLVDVGNLVGPATGQNTSGATTNAGSASSSSSNIAGAQTLVTITQMQPIYVTFNVPQDRLEEIKHNQAAAPLEVDAYSQSGKLIEKGKLTVIDNHVNTSAGTVMLQGTFANAQEALWPGEFVRVTLLVSVRKNVVTIPTQSVLAGPNGDYVYVIEGNRAVKRVDVEVAAHENTLAVIEKGLSGGEQVVVDGQYRLENGVKVDVRESATVAQRAQRAEPE